MKCTSPLNQSRPVERLNRFWEERVATLERQLDHYRAVEASRLRAGGSFMPFYQPPADAPRAIVTRVDIPIIRSGMSSLTGATAAILHGAEVRSAVRHAAGADTLADIMSRCNGTNNFCCWR